MNFGSQIQAILADIRATDGSRHRWDSGCAAAIAGQRSDTRVVHRNWKMRRADDK
jgi:hypothetical protein